MTTKLLIIGSAILFSYLTSGDGITGPILVILIHALTWHLHVIEVKVNKVLATLGAEVTPREIDDA